MCRLTLVLDRGVRSGKSYTTRKRRRSPRRPGTQVSVLVPSVRVVSAVSVLPPSLLMYLDASSYLQRSSPRDDSAFWVPLHLTPPKRLFHYKVDSTSTVLPRSVPSYIPLSSILTRLGVSPPLNHKPLLVFPPATP